MADRYQVVQRERPSGLWPAILDTELAEWCGLVTVRGSIDIARVLNDGTLPREVMQNWRPEPASPDSEDVQ